MALRNRTILARGLCTDQHPLRNDRAGLFYSAVAAGLARILGVDLPRPAADPTSFFRDKVVEYIELFWEKRQPCLLVIEGLDEAAGWQVDTLRPDRRENFEGWRFFMEPTSGLEPLTC
jgi:hypothetical protein